MVTQPRVPIETIQDLIQKRKYNNALYSTLKNLLPDGNPSKDDICSNVRLIKYLTEIYQDLPKYYNKEPILKATYLIAIANILNNKVALLFTPEYAKEIRTCVNLQKIALAYLKRAIITLNKASCMLPFERVNDINYLLNLIELNLHIILLSDKGRLYGDDEIKSRLLVINKRLIALEQKDPNPDYYKLQSLVMHYLGEVQSAYQASVNSVKTIYLKNNLSNLDKLQYKLRYTGKLHPVVVYE